MALQKGAVKLIFRGLMPSVYLIIGLCILWTGCGINPFEPDIITNLRFSPDTFDSYKRNTSLKYSLLKSAKVSIHIYDSNGEKVKTLISNLLETKGTHSHGWLGISDKGQFVPAGIYLAKVKADADEAFASVEIFHF